MRNVIKLYFIIAILLITPSSIFGQAFSLGSISSFALFTSNGAVANTGVSNVTGNIGSDIGAVSGFGLPSILNGNQYNSDAITAQAKIDLFIAYNQLMSMPATNTTHTPAFGSAETLTTGVYVVSGAGSLAGNLTLDGLGDTNSVFIFRFGGAYAVGASSSVILTNGARSCNIFWVAEGAIAMGASTIMKGTLLCNNAAVSAAAGCNIEGRMLSTTGAIAFGPAIISKPICNSNIILPFPPPCCNPSFGATIDFVIFTSNGSVSNTGPSILKKNIGTDLGAFIGFAPATVIGTMYNADSVTATTKVDLFSLYNQLTINPVTNSSHAAAFGGGETLTSGVYYVGNASSLAGNLTLDAQYDTNSVFIFKIRGAFAAAAASNMILVNLASSCSVFWVVEGAISIGAGSVMKGTYIANNAAVSMQAGGNLKGRLFSTNGAIAFDNIDADNSDPCHQPTYYNLLPIELLSFTANANNNKEIIIEWKTATQINNDYFNIERSADAINFTSIGKIKGAGNSTQTLNYSIVDDAPLKETSYYRLKQTDFNKKHSYSKIISVEDIDFEGLKDIYPNPTSGNVSFNLLVKNGTDLNIEIIDYTGKVVFSKNQFIDKGSNSINLNLTDIKSGVYVLKVIIGKSGKIFINKIIKN